MNKFTKIGFKLIKFIKGGEFYASKIAPIYAKEFGVNIGRNCRLFSTDFSSEPYLITIGDNVTISSKVSFITHDGGTWVLRNLDKKYKNSNIIGEIKIGNNVFIGLGSTILPGITIGENCIIASGSVVTKSFEANSVIGGVPAKKIKNLYEYIEDNEEILIDTKNLNEIEKKKYILENNKSILMKNK